MLWAMLLSVLGLSEAAVMRAHVPIFRTVDKKLDWVLLQFPFPGDSGESGDDDDKAGEEDAKACTPDAVKLDVGTGGGGGGRPTFAQGGGSHANGLAAALDAARATLDL